MKKIVVTGGNGFIGSNLINFLLKKNYFVINIDKNKYTRSSGSLIGVLNLTIDKAPTNPKERANEDLTTVIITQTVSVKGSIELLICLPPEILWLEYLYELAISNPKIAAKNSDKPDWKILAGSIGTILGDSILSKIWSCIFYLYLNHITLNLV